MLIHRASLEDLEIIVPLFDSYRVFYKQSSDVEAGRRFIEARLRKEDSVIFFAVSESGTGIGFTQLYPIFSSVAMQRVYILNDLYVSVDSRGQGIGKALLEHAMEFARKEECRGLTLETALDNPARRLYERLGWKNDEEVIHYTWEL